MKEKKKEYKEEKKEKVEESKLDFEKELHQTKDSILRLQAEFDNYRKRTNKEKQYIINIATEQLILKILPIIDNFKLALQTNNEKSEFKQGIEMILKQLERVLEDEGVTKIQTREFDPNFHEAVLVEKGKDKKILQVLQEGYMIYDKVLRNAKVKISKGDEK